MASLSLPQLLAILSARYHSASSGQAAVPRCKAAWLAHPDDMHARAKYLQKGGDVIDKLVEAELVLPQADVARVVPVGDIDVMVGEKRLRMPRSKVAKCPDIGATSST